MKAQRGKWKVDFNNNATNELHERIQWTLYFDSEEVMTSPKEFKSIDLAELDAREKITQLSIQLHGLTTRI